MDNKFTKIWFDENLVKQEEIPERCIWLTREELAERFDINLVNDPAKPEIWYGGNQVGQAMVLADIQRVIKSLQDDVPMHEPRYLSAHLYDTAKAAGYPLGGVMRLAPIYAVQHPPAAAKSRAALHPLVGRLIDKFNKEN